jgi:hypothetical protein
MPEYAQYLETMKEILAKSPKDGWRLRDVAVGHQRIANAEFHLGKLQQARNNLEECRSFSVGASTSFDPRNPEPRHDVAAVCQEP